MDIEANSSSIGCSYFGCLLLLLNYYIIDLGTQLHLFLIFRNCLITIMALLVFSSLILKTEACLYLLLKCLTLKCLHCFDFRY